MKKTFERPLSTSSQTTFDEDHFENYGDLSRKNTAHGRHTNKQTHAK